MHIVVVYALRSCTYIRKTHPVSSLTILYIYIYIYIYIYTCVYTYTGIDWVLIGAPHTVREHGAPQNKHHTANHRTVLYVRRPTQVDGLPQPLYKKKRTRKSPIVRYEYNTMTNTKHIKHRVHAHDFAHRESHNLRRMHICTYINGCTYLQFIPMVFEIIIPMIPKSSYRWFWFSAHTKSGFVIAMVFASPINIHVFSLHL